MHREGKFALPKVVSGSRQREPGEVLQVGRIVGFDLGTTYSAVAHVNASGQPEIIPNREGERITPSVIFFQGDLAQVGTQAKRSAVTSPNDVVQFVKRQMGNPAWKFVTEAGELFTAEQLSAIILKRLKEDAEIFLGDEVTDAVVTVPAYFDDARRKATMDAGAIAGLDVKRVINEPTAAALSYGLDVSYTGTVMVFDLGGGTFDVTLMRISPDEFDVIGTQGDRNLGGFDWDNRIIQLFAEQIAEAGGPDIFDDDSLLAEARDRAETAKRTLSNLPEARAFMSIDGSNHTLTVTRDEFESATKDLMRRAEVIVEEVLEDAGLDWTAVDELLLVGGSTRMPMVVELLERLSDVPMSRKVHPDEAVALGAAVQAHLVAQQGSTSELLPALVGTSDDGPRISDVTSQGLGVAALDERQVLVNTIMIPHNTKVPAKVTERFFTVRDHQTEVELQVTEGDEEDLEYVSIIHQEPLKIPPHPRESPIEVVMAYDIDATIHIEVVDLTTNESLGEVELDRPSNLEPRQVAEMTAEMQQMEVY